MCLPTLWPPGRRCLSVVKGAISCCVRVKMTLESSRWTPLPLPLPASPDVLPRAGAAVTGRRGRRRGGTRGRAVPNAEKIREFSRVARNAKHVSGTICSCKRGTFSIFIRLRPKWSYPFSAVDSCKRGQCRDAADDEYLLDTAGWSWTRSRRWLLFPPPPGRPTFVGRLPPNQSTWGRRACQSRNSRRCRVVSCYVKSSALRVLMNRLVTRIT